MCAPPARGELASLAAIETDITEHAPPLEREPDPSGNVFFRLAAVGAAPWPVAIAAAVVAGLVYAVLLRSIEGPIDPEIAPIWVLGIVFLGAELYVIHARGHNELTGLSPHDAGIVLGLFLLTPEALLAAQLAGSAVALVAARRDRPSAIASRLASLALGTCLALAIFHMLVSGHDPEGLAGWGAAVVAVFVSAIVGIGLAVLAHGRQAVGDPLSRSIVIALAGALASASIALAAVALARASDAAAVLLIIPFASFAIALRAYTSERLRLEHLKGLYDSMRAMQVSPVPESGASELLAAARRLAGSDLARLVVFPGASATRPLVAFATGAADASLEPTNLSTAEREVVQSVSSSGAGVILTARLGGAGAKLLSELGLGEAIVTPLYSDDGAHGTLLVGNRPDAERRLSHEDIRALETFAGHAGVVLENDRLERSLTELTQLKEQLRHQAYHDALTGLPNRTLFAERVARTLAGESEPVCTVLFLDLDDFKTINDSLGHLVGDELLVAVARRVKNSVRPGDVPARLGGDEFAVLAPGTTAAEAEVIAGRMVRELDAPFLIEGRDISVHASIGIASGQPGNVTADELLRNADVAMYDAKRGGKRQFVRYEPKMHRRVAQRQELASALERAVARGEIGVHYQPIVDVRTRKVVAMESLARWDRRENGLMQPTSFIPLADELGFMVEIGRAVLRESCRQARAWQLAFPGHEHLTVNVNLAPSELHNPLLADDVRSILLETGLAPERLVLEITESGVMLSPDTALRTMSELRELGVGLALDDFGTGHSSLAHLREFPIDTLKIASPFVARLPDEELDAVFVDAIVRLASSLRIPVVAEGIENEGQSDAIGALGCSYGQGFFYGEPLGRLGVSAYLGSETLPIVPLAPLHPTA
jgi:diguanylate cyclase (GGDEF)-like protein